MPAALGFLGVGSIAEAIVHGYCSDVASPPLALSPRSRGRVADLAQRYPTVRVAADNQALVEAAETVVVCLRPSDAEVELKRLQFAAGQGVVSVMAGVSVRRLAELVAPARVVARAIPMPAVARREGVTALYCPSGDAYQALSWPGRLLVVDSEATFDALSAATATVAAHFRYLATIADWLVAHGASVDVAETYIRDTFDALSDASDRPPLSTAAAGHATPGGINEQFLAAMDRTGVFPAIDEALGDVIARLTADVDT